MVSNEIQDGLIKYSFYQANIDTVNICFHLILGIILQAILQHLLLEHDKGT